MLLLVEGQDEEYLVQKMCEQWFGQRAEKIDIECVGGKDNFPKRFRVLKVRSLGPLKVVGVIADSEEDAAATAQRWAQLFKDVEPSIKRPCKKLQLPRDDAAGAFEALVLDAWTGDPIADCAINFRDCVSPHLGERTLAKKDKIAVQAWLSAKLGNAYGNVFKAQDRHPEHQLVNYDHTAFAPIKAFIETLLAEAEAGVTKS
ncbi:hypothetical protein IWX85_001597 [Polaromonas sp. CG_9.11]|nr:hypothetical protein [Polaromonas sp. CG_9.11]